MRWAGLQPNLETFLAELMRRFVQGAELLFYHKFSAVKNPRWFLINFFSQSVRIERALACVAGIEIMLKLEVRISRRDIIVWYFDMPHVWLPLMDHNDRMG